MVRFHLWDFENEDGGADTVDDVVGELTIFFGRGEIGIEAIGHIAVDGDGQVRTRGGQFTREDAVALVDFAEVILLRDAREQIDIERRDVVLFHPSGELVAVLAPVVVGISGNFVPIFYATSK